MSARGERSGGGLLRGLNAWDTTLLVIGSIVGGGIFLTPGEIAKVLPAAGGILAVWVVGGLFTLAGSLVYAELGAMLPETGGTYVYLREAYGPLVGFLYAWTYFLVYNGGGVAAIATGFAKYAAVFVPAVGMDRIAGRLLGHDVSSGQLLAVAAILLLSATHYVGIRVGARVQGFFTLLILGTMAAFTLLGALASGPAAAPASAAPITLSGFGVAMVAVLWTYDGWSQIAGVAGEVKRPQRNVPMALVLGVGVVTLFYVAANAVFLKAIPVAGQAGIECVAAAASTKLFGIGATLVVSAAILVSGFGCTSANLVPGPRVAFAVARDRLFPAPFANVHPKFRTPALGIVVQAAWTSLLCLSGRYDQLYTYAMFIGVGTFTAAGVALFVFRKKRPDAPRPYRCWGYPVVPALFIAGSLLFLGNTIVRQPLESLAGVAILVLGLPVYVFFTRRGRASA